MIRITLYFLAASATSDLQSEQPHLVDVGAVLPVRVELGYSSTHNFMHQDVYGDLDRCYLVADAKEMLAVALRNLQARNPDFTFILYDCARPRSVQMKMWEAVKGSKQQGYVANPHKPPGSVHNTGCAVDVSVFDVKKNSPLDMGTPWDFFGRAAQPRHEADLWKEGKLTSEQLANRLLLREVMLRAGWRMLPHEWWHFDCATATAAKKQYPTIP